MLLPNINPFQKVGAAAGQVSFVLPKNWFEGAFDIDLILAVLMPFQQLLLGFQALRVEMVPDGLGDPLDLDMFKWRSLETFVGCLAGPPFTWLFVGLIFLFLVV